MRPARRARIRRSGAAAEGAITAAIGKVMAVAEAYPDLKASANFQSLQNDLANIEDQIPARAALLQRLRSATSMSSVQQFPSNLIAGIGGFTAAKFFELDNAADRNVPKVSFS